MKVVILIIVGYLLVGTSVVYGAVESLSDADFVDVGMTDEPELQTQELEKILEHEPDVSIEEWWEVLGIEEPLEDLYRGENQSDTEAEQAAFSQEDILKLQFPSANDVPSNDLNKYLLDEINRSVDSWNPLADTLVAKADNMSDEEKQLYDSYAKNLEEQSDHIDELDDMMDIWVDQYAIRRDSESSTNSSQQ